MGGGDLNSKKSWHPNTMKNQERVWKAEQAVAEEKKRILELQRERAEERDRADLNSLIKHSSTSTSGNQNRLSWMYDKPDKKVDQEAYLLGKSIDKNAEQTDKPEQDAIPAVSRRVVGSSMLTASGDTQVDMSRKIREDPLLMIKERERAARAALLNNPLQRRKLAELLRKEQDLRKEGKTKRAPKNKEKNLDNLLAAKLNALGGQKGIDLATLLNSEDSTSESSSDEKQSKKKRKKEKHAKEKKKKKHHNFFSDSDDSEDEHYKKKESMIEDKKSSKKTDYQIKEQKKSELRKNKSSEDDKYSDSEVKSKKYKKKYQDKYSHKREYEEDYKSSREYNRKKYSSKPYHGHEKIRNNNKVHRESKKTGVMSEKERAAKLAEMAAAGAEREIERGRRVASQRAADLQPEGPRLPRSDTNSARALPDSLESRIHSNRHYIQRDKRHMNEHFARR